MVQEMLHQHADGEADGVGLTRADPLSDIGEQQLVILFKYSGGHLVAGGPVVHIGQEPLNLFNAGAEIFFL